MSASWNHAVRPMTADEMRVAAVQGRVCGTGRCRGKATYRTSYRYTAGRSGRATDADRLACGYHVYVFAKKHGLTVPLSERQLTTDNLRAVEAELNEIGIATDVCRAGTGAELVVTGLRFAQVAGRSGRTLFARLGDWITWENSGVCAVRNSTEEAAR